MFRGLMASVLGVVVALSVCGWCAAADAKEPIKIGAIFSVTGSSSFLGAPEKNTAEMLVAQINAAGGVNGQPLVLIVKDDAGDPKKAGSFAKQLIDEEKVFAIIGPSISGSSLEIKELCEENKMLLLSCAAAEKIVNPLAKYVFKTPQNDGMAAIRIFTLMKEMGIKKVGVVSDNTGFGKGGQEQLKRYAKDYGIEVAIAEVYSTTDTDLTAVLEKVKQAGVGAVVNWSVVPAQSIVCKNMKQIGLNVPLFQSHGFGNVKFAQAAGPAADGLIFPCGRLLVADVLADDHPQKKLLLKYKQDYETKFKPDLVSTFGGHAYDALTILVAAIQKVGADREKVRSEIENMKGFVGTAGVFNFSPQDHNGLTLEAFEMLTVKDGKFVLYKK